MIRGIKYGIGPSEIMERAVACAKGNFEETHRFKKYICNECLKLIRS